MLPRHTPRSTVPGLVTLDDPLDRLRGRPRNLRGPTVGAHLPVGGNNVHSLSRRLQWKLLGGAVTGWHRHRHRPGHKLPDDTTNEEPGTFTWPPARTSNRPHAGTFSWPRTHAWSPIRSSTGVSRDAFVGASR